MRIRQAAVCILVLGFLPGILLAQAHLEKLPSDWQYPPTLTPSPVPAVAPRPRVPEVAIEKVALDAGVLFDFGSFTLRPESRAALDEFVDRLKGVTRGAIRAVGHADRLGSDALNQTLSEERAEAVKAYLILRGIESGSVNAAGRGATQPITERGQCTGAGGEQLISCLQPDRRATVEVAGTRASDGPASP